MSIPSVRWHFADRPRGNSRRFANNFKRVAAYWELLMAWTGRTVRARYQQSVLGISWAVIQPAATVAILSVVFTRFVTVDTGGVPYILFSFATLVPWTLFSASLTDIVNSVTDNMNLVSKVYFPRELLAFAAILARLVDFAIALGVLVAMMVYYGAPLFGWVWLYFPIITIILLVLALGLGLAGAALNVFYRDIKHLLVLGLQLWLYASPILYPVSAVPEGLRGAYFLNPIAGVVEGYRSVLLLGKPPSSQLLWSAFVAIVALLIGLSLFRKLEPEFADIG